MTKYVVRRTNLICPEDWYLGAHPVTGEFTRCRIGEFSQEALAAWLKKDPANAAKYVQVVKVPGSEEPTPKTKGRKASKKIKNEQSKTASSTDKAEAQTPEDTGDPGEQPDNGE